METIADRIKLALRGESVTSLAKRMSLKQSSIQNIFAGSEPSAKRAADIAAALGVSLEWLITGSGEMQSGLGSKATIRNFDVEAAAGVGRMVLQEKEAAPLAIDAEWLWKTFKHRPADVFTIRVVGDSMLPDLVGGSLILVDGTAPKQKRQDGIWVFREGDQIKVKRLQFVGKKVQVESLNTTYKPYKIEGVDLAASNFALIGMVLGTLNGKN